MIWLHFKILLTIQTIYYKVICLDTIAERTGQHPSYIADDLTGQVDDKYEGQHNSAGYVQLTPQQVFFDQGKHIYNINKFWGW